MSGQGGMMMGLPGGVDGETRFPGQNRGQLVGGPVDKPIFGGNPIDQPIYGFNPGQTPDSNTRDFLPMLEPIDHMLRPGLGDGGGFNPGDGGGKGGFPPPSVGIDPSPIQGGGGGGGSNGPGLDHLKDYGPVVDQMKQYVQSMSGLIDQINSKF